MACVPSVLTHTHTQNAALGKFPGVVVLKNVPRQLMVQCQNGPAAVLRVNRLFIDMELALV